MDSAALEQHSAGGGAPGHVAQSLIFDIASGELTDKAMSENPFSVWTAHADLPPVFWSTRAPGLTQPGCWVARSAAAIRQVMLDTEYFSNDRSRAEFNVTLSGVTGLVPLFMDPPEANSYRLLLARLFSPDAVDVVEPSLRSQSGALIDAFAAKGECDFMADYARLFPVSVFLRLMGMPLSQRDQFVEWEHHLYQGKTQAERRKALGEVSDYMRELTAEKRQTPGDDVISKLIAAQIDGVTIAPDKLHGMLMLLYMAGLDTVAAGLGHVIKHLAEQPELQRRLRENSKLIPAALEELLRYNSWLPTGRLCVKEIDFHGAKIKPGDWVQTNFFTGSNDASEVRCPREFQLDRQPNRHFAFGYGAHLCAGIHLARRELKIALEMFLDRLGEFRIRPGAEIRYDGGYVCLGSLPLIWEPQTAGPPA